MSSLLFAHAEATTEDTVAKLLHDGRLDHGLKVVPKQQDVALGSKDAFAAHQAAGDARCLAIAHPHHRHCHRATPTSHLGAGCGL